MTKTLPGGAQLTQIPDKPRHFRIWIDGREHGYLRHADEVTPSVWRACDDAGENVVEHPSKLRCFAAYLRTVVK